MRTRQAGPPHTRRSHWRKSQTEVSMRTQLTHCPALSCPAGAAGFSAWSESQLSSPVRPEPCALRPAPCTGAAESLREHLGLGCPEPHHTVPQGLSPG